MILTCPKCGKQIDPVNINIAQDMAFCAACGEMHKVSVLCAAQTTPPQAAVPASGGRFCVKCGAQLAEGIQFCTGCGTPVGAAQSPTMQPVQQAQPQYQQPQYQQASGTKKSAWGYFTGAMKKYTVFQGRARRAEFWWFAVFTGIIIYVVSYIVGYIVGYIGAFLGFLDYADEEVISFISIIVQLIVQLPFLLPSLAVGIRRMHDVGKSGWYILIPIYDFVLACTAGNTGPNQYGTDPKTE